MHQFSDSDTPDSDEGIRFKTDSTRNKESNRKSLDSSRKRRSSRSRTRSPEKRSNRGRSPDRSRDRYRERRSYSREWRRRHKSRDRSKERPAKYDRRDKRKRSASTELKTDALKRKRDSKHSKSKERDTKKPPSTDKDVESAKQKVLKTTKDGEIHLEEAFGPALPPKLLLNDDDAKDSSSSVSPKRQCKHKKKHVIKSKEDDKTAALDKKTTIMSTSPISSDNDESAPEDDSAANKETLESLVPDVQENQHKDVIEIEDSDIEHENQTNSDKKNDNGSTKDCYGPDIPPKHTEDVELSSSKSVGPFLPEHLRQKLLENADENGTADISLSDEDDEIEEGEIVGPILPGTKESLSASQIALEERALQYKLDRLSTGNSSSDLNAREDWMLTLPEAGTAAKIGLGPRQFRAKAAPDMGDRSGWTDTPTDREAKQRSGKAAPREDNGADYKAEADKLEIEERDKEQERMARRHHKKHRKKDKHEKSLLEMHQDKLKSNKKEEDTQNIRRPFNRDIDLKVNQFDDAQKKAIYKKAQLLDTRFSKGESKYL